MKSTLIIKDLVIDKELDRKAMSAMRGGIKRKYAQAPLTVLLPQPPSHPPVSSEAESALGDLGFASSARMVKFPRAF